MNDLLATDHRDTKFQIPELSAEVEHAPDWIRQLRRTARDIFNEAPIPHRGVALWRYTDPATFLIRHGQTVDAHAYDDDDINQRLRKRVDNGELAALVTDHCDREIRPYGTETMSKQGIIITSISSASVKHPDIVQKHLSQLVGSKTGKFEAMNLALFNDGIFIYIPDGVTIGKPIHLLRQAGRERSAYFPRLLVVVGHNAGLTLIDEYAGGATDPESGRTSVNGAVELFGMEDSRVRYVTLQRQYPGTDIYLTHRAVIRQNATMLTIPILFGGHVSKFNFGVDLNGPGAESNMYGLLFGSHRQHFDNHTRHHHTADNTISNIDYKVVLRDKAVSAYTGLIKIEQTARTCEAYQGNRNLLLNKGTRADTIPELEILNEDVKCSHGATIGPIDPEMIFFLNARGIDSKRAVQMIISGFVAATLKEIPVDLQERVSDFVENRLEDI